MRRRRAVEHLQRAHDASERHACRVTGQPRSTQRYRAKDMPREEERLQGEMRRLAGEHPRFGYRRVRQLLMRDGWSLSPSRAQRPWRQEGLKVPSKRALCPRPSH